MPVPTLLSRMMKSFVLIFLLHFSIQGFSQQPTTREERTVTGKAVFICTYGSHAPGTDTFPTAEAGCKHWLTHLPAGYVFQKVQGVNEIGAVTCICKKGNEVNDQGGMIRGVIICPDELAVPISDGTPFPNKKCECPDKLSPPYYIAKGNKCVLDCATKLEDEREEVPGSKNTFKGTPEEHKVAGDRIREHRAKNPKGSGNYGYVEGDIAGKTLPGDMVGSGAPDKGINQIFEASSVNKAQILGGEGGWIRNTDSEYKMLNRLANDLGATKGETYCDTQGTLKIVSERPYCPSCQNVIKQFNDMYPNVKLILVDGVK